MEIMLSSTLSIDKWPIIYFVLMSVENIPFALINKSWTDEQRRIVWCMICKARCGLQVEISPIVATAFIILQRYFRNSDSCSYDLFILMNASLFTACKAADCFRPIQVVYRELSRICQSAPSAKIRSIMGDRDTQSTEIDQRDFLQITQAELDLLKSIDFDFDIDTPFTHFNRWKQTLIDVVPDEAIMQLCNSIIIDICLMICSAFYLDVPPEVAAAAATEDSLKTQIIPAETLEWLNSVKAKYGQEVFTLAIESIACEKRKTATIPRQPQRKPPLK